MRDVDPSSVPGFLDLERPPERLWLEGDLPTGPALAIVGTRRADPAAVRFARTLSRRLAEAGAIIVSGGARGIDTAAHQGALDAGAPTVVVQGASLADPYPRSNHRLFADVLRGGGAWLSETPPGAPAAAFRFLARNRLIAAMADVVLVVQAPFPSGALSTASHASKLARPLFVVPAAPWDRRSAGGLALLREHARLCFEADDLAAALGLTVGAPSAPEAPPEELREVLAALGAEPVHPDVLAEQTGLGAAELSARLVRLQLRGLAASGPGGWRATGESARLSP